MLVTQVLLHLTVLVYKSVRLRFAEPKKQSALGATYDNSATCKIKWHMVGQLS